MKSDSAFQSAIKKLNSEQLQAVKTIDGPVFVVAGPGTGKTQILILRIANILYSTDTPPETILALTFTESATIEMRDRLARLIGSRAQKVRISTFHGFAQSLVEQYPDNFSRIIGSQVATDIERAEILEDVLLRAKVKYLRPFGDPLYYHSAVANAISTLKRENINTDVFIKRLSEIEAEFDAIPDKIHSKGKYAGKLKGIYEGQLKKIAKTRDLLVIYNEYENELIKRKRYDFDDLMLETVNALKDNDAFRREVQESIFYLLADEHQDANATQNALLELLVECNDSPNLFIVGDEKQAIYRFQGADLDTMHYFRKRFSDTKIIPLHNNYRSTQMILDAAISLIDASLDTRLSRVPLKSNILHTKGNPINVIKCITPEDEESYIAKDIIEHIRNGIPPQDIVVLLRRNRDVVSFAESLRTLGVPAIGTEQNIFENRFVMALIRLLSTVNEPRNSQFSSIMSLPGFRIPVVDALSISDASRKMKVPIFTILSSQKKLSDININNKDAANGLHKFIEHLSHIASIERPAVVADEALRNSGILEEVLQSPDRDESLLALRAFINILNELSAREHDALLPRALAQISSAREHGISPKVSFLETVNQVKVMTVHRAKGREFSSVYIPRFVHRIWSGRSRGTHFYMPGVLTTESELEDERRLFYVAITRAKEHCSISYAQTKNDGGPEALSAFIDDIDSTLIAHINAPSISDTFSQRSRIIMPHGSMPTKNERAVLTSMFTAQGLTPTSLNNYLLCPWHYFYVNLLRIPEAENKFMFFGTAIHTTLKYYADKRNIGEDIAVTGLIDVFTNAIAHVPITTLEFKELVNKGERALNEWWKVRHNSWPEHTVAEKSIETTLKIGNSNIIIRGKLDRADFTEEGIVIVDYKTGKTKTHNELLGKTKGSNGNYFRQLIFYKLLLSLSSEPKEMDIGVIDFVEPDEKNKIHEERFIITQNNVNELKDTIKLVSDEIRTLSFWNTHCDDEKCEWCALRLL